MKPENFLEHLSSHLKNALARGISLATTLGHKEVTPLHLLYSVNEEVGSVGGEILDRMKCDGKSILAILSSLPSVIGNPETPTTTPAKTTSTIPQLNIASKQALERAMLAAYERAHQYIGTEHLLYGLLRSDDSFITQALDAQQITQSHVVDELENILEHMSKFPDMDDVKDVMEQLHDLMADGDGGQNEEPQTKAVPHKHTNRAKQPRALDVFTTDLTKKQFQVNIDPVIGREREIERLIHILLRRNKNNPLLIGEPGVGKTAIVEGLAKKISTGDVPDLLKRKKILSLDLTLLIAGTIYRGEFEARLKQVIDEVTAQPDTLLFIDEIHNIIGAGSNQGTWTQPIF